MSKRYLSAWGALYGNTPLPSTTKIRSSHSVKISQKERHIQEALATWLTKKGILFYSIPNEGRRNHVTAANLKRRGMKAGVPDICIPIPRKGYGALYIELKRDGGIVRDNQQYWIRELTAKGNLAIVCYSLDEAVRATEQYLSL